MVVEFRHNTIASLISCNCFKNHHTISYMVLISEYYWTMAYTQHWESFIFAGKFRKITTIPCFFQRLFKYVNHKNKISFTENIFCYYFHFRVSYAFLFRGSSYRAIPKDKEKHKYCNQEHLMRQSATTSCQEGNHKDKKWCLPLPNLLTKFQLFLTETGSDIQAMNFRDTLAMDGANKSHKHNSEMIYGPCFAQAPIDKIMK